MDDIYVQTASFSRELLADFHGSLDKISSYGYTGLEMFDKIYGGYSAPELKAYLDRLGLSVIGAHIRIEDTTDEDMKYLNQLGCPYLVCPGLALKSEEDAFRAAETLNAMGKRWKSYGLKFG